MNSFAKQLLENAVGDAEPDAKDNESENGEDQPSSKGNNNSCNIETEMAALNYVRSLFPADVLQKVPANRRHNLANALKHVAAELELEDGRTGV